MCLRHSCHCSLLLFTFYTTFRLLQSFVCLLKVMEEHHPVVSSVTHPWWRCCSLTLPLVSGFDISNHGRLGTAALAAPCVWRAQRVNIPSVGVCLRTSCESFAQQTCGENSLTAAWERGSASLIKQLLPKAHTHKHTHIRTRYPGPPICAFMSLGVVCFLCVLFLSAKETICLVEFVHICGCLADTSVPE